MLISSAMHLQRSLDGMPTNDASMSVVTPDCNSLDFAASNLRAPAVVKSRRPGMRMSCHSLCLAQAPAAHKIIGDARSVKTVIANPPEHPCGGPRRLTIRQASCRFIRLPVSAWERPRVDRNSG
jgi:hypothetical protein